MRERLEWIEDPNRLAAAPLAVEWDGLAARQRAPFLRSGWFSCWWDAFGSRDRLAICALWRGEELAGVFPLSRRGSRLRSLANVHTPFFKPLAADAAAFDRIVTEALGCCSELEIFGLPRGDAALASLECSAAAQGRLALCEPQHVSPIVETGGDLDHYLRDRRTDLREVARRRRKSERENGADLRPIEAPRDLATELERGLRLESSGWKGRGGPAILSDTRATRCYRSIASEFHASGELRFSSLELDGRLAALDFAVVSEGRYWLLKTAYDESRARLGPGMALRLALVERCFELGLDGHEFLGDDMPYKRRFSTAERRHVGFRSYTRGWGPLLRYVYRRRARPLLKHSYRRVRAVGAGRMA